MNKYTERAEIYWDVMQEELKADCKLTVCLALYGDMYWKNKDCTHVFCKCEHCIKSPTCLKCRLFIQTGRYL